MADPVIVVGGGVAGLFVAGLVGSRDVVVFEASRRVGWPPHCTGIVSPGTARRLGAWGVVESFYKCAVFLDERLVERCRLCRDGGFLAVRLDRPGLEELLFERVVSRGHRVVLGARVEAVGDGFVVVRGRGVVRGSAVVVAEGGVRRFSRRLFGPCGVVEGVEARVVVSRRLPDDVFYTVHGPRFSGGLFGWVVPVAGGREVLVGAAGRGALAELSWLLERLESRWGLVARVVSRRAGLVVTGPPARRVRRGSVVGVGDAVCASKPFTGGGLYALSILGRAVAEAVDGGGWGVVDRVWAVLRRELVLQWVATRIAKRVESWPWLWWRLLGLICGCRSVDFDVHSSVLGCLAGVGFWRG